MTDKFDPYREALVVETMTAWADDVGDLDDAKKRAIAKQLHANAANCTQLEYIRLSTGFCRRITVTKEDIPS